MTHNEIPQSNIEQPKELNDAEKLQDFLDNVEDADQLLKARLPKKVASQIDGKS